MNMSTFKSTLDKFTIQRFIMTSDLETDVKWAMLSILEKDSKKPHISSIGMKMMGVLNKSVAFDTFDNQEAYEAYVNLYKPMVQENLCVGVKAFPSISHLPGSNMTDENDTTMSYENFRYVIANRKNAKLKIIIRCEEKSDGSCVGVANIPGIGIVAISKAGYDCTNSPHMHHRAFAKYVQLNLEKFDFLLPGERIMGEWMLLRHAIPYQIDSVDDLFRPFAYIASKHKYEYSAIQRMPGSPVISYHHDLNINLLFSATIDELMTEWENKNGRKLMESTNHNDYKEAYFAIHDIITEKALRKLDNLHPDGNYEGYVIKMLTKLPDITAFPIRTTYNLELQAKWVKPEFKPNPLALEMQILNIDEEKVAHIL